VKIRLDFFFKSNHTPTSRPSARDVSAHAFCVSVPAESELEASLLRSSLAVDRLKQPAHTRAALSSIGGSGGDSGSSGSGGGERGGGGGGGGGGGDRGELGRGRTRSMGPSEAHNSDVAAHRGGHESGDGKGGVDDNLSERSTSSWPSKWSAGGDMNDDASFSGWGTERVDDTRQEEGSRDVLSRGSSSSIHHSSAFSNFSDANGGMQGQKSDNFKWGSGESIELPQRSEGPESGFKTWPAARPRSRLSRQPSARNAKSGPLLFDGKEEDSDSYSDDGFEDEDEDDKPAR